MTIDSDVAVTAAITEPSPCEEIMDGTTKEYIDDRDNVALQQPNNDNETEPTKALMVESTTDNDPQPTSPMESKQDTVPFQAENPTPDEILIEEAMKWYSETCYFKAASCFERVRDKSILSPFHLHIIELAHTAHTVMQQCITIPDDIHHHESEWIKQTELHNAKYDTSIHYKINENCELTSRIESIIDPTLLVPLLAVFNESDLYSTWMPNHNFPFRLGIQESKVLGEYGRGNQAVFIGMKMPYPFISDRQTIYHVYAIDAIDPNDWKENAEGSGSSHEPVIVMKSSSLQVGTYEYYNNLMIDEPPPGIKRIDMEIGFTIRACPKDHPLYIAREKKKQEQEAKKHRSNKKNKDNKQGPMDANTTDDNIDPKATKNDDEKLMLITNIMQVNAHVSGIPIRLQNFFLRIALSRLWHSLFDVAEEVRDGKRPVHQECITQKYDELYGWVEQRIETMLEYIKKDVQADKILQEVEDHIMAATTK